MKNIQLDLGLLSPTYHNIVMKTLMKIHMNF